MVGKLKPLKLKTYAKNRSFFLFHFQKFSDWTQEWFGLNNFFWARICLAAVLVVYVMIRIIYIAMDSSREAFQFSLLYILIFTLIIGIVLYVINKIELEFNNNPKFINRYVKDWFWTRMRSWFLLLLCLIAISYFVGTTENILLLVCSLEFIKLVLYAMLSGLGTLVFYFGSCSPKPPQEKKIKNLIEQLKEKLSIDTPRLATMRT